MRAYERIPLRRSCCVEFYGGVVLHGFEILSEVESEGEFGVFLYIFLSKEGLFFGDVFIIH